MKTFEEWMKLYYIRHGFISSNPELEALSLPDLASPVLNRVKAEALRDAADEFDAQGEWKGHGQQLCNMADDIEKGEKTMLLTEQEIEDLYYTELDRRELSFARAIETKVIEKIKAQGGVVRRITTQDSMTGEITMNEEILYRLPEGE